MKVSDKELLAYFKQHFQHQNYQYDLYLLFLERYHALLKEKGLLGVIVPNTWLQSVTFTKIRKHLLGDYRWHKILHGKEHIFDAVVDTHVLVFEKGSLKGKSLFDVDITENQTIVFYQQLDQNSFDKNGGIINILAKPEATALFKKIQAASETLGTAATVYNGIKPFEKGKGTPPQTEEIVEAKPFVKENQSKPAGANWKTCGTKTVGYNTANGWQHRETAKFLKPKKKSLCAKRETASLPPLSVKTSSAAIICTSLSPNSTTINFCWAC